MKTVRIYPTAFHIDLYIWPVRILIFGQIQNQYEIRYTKFENGSVLCQPFSTFPVFTRISRFWPTESLTLENLYLFHTISDEDFFYIKVVALDEIYNFLDFFLFEIVKMFKKVNKVLAVY